MSHSASPVVPWDGGTVRSTRSRTRGLVTSVIGRVLFSRGRLTRTPNSHGYVAWGMGRFSDLLGGGSERPPAPEMATAEDVERYNMEFVKAHNIEADTSPDRNPEESGFAKAANPFEDDVTSRAKFPWLADPSRGVRWDFDPVKLRNLAQGNTWVGMLVQSITKEIAETPWTITTADSGTETQKRLGTHPEEREPVTKELPDATAERIYDTLQSPTPDMMWHDAIEMWVADLLEVGSMAAVKAFPSSAYGPEGEEFVAEPGAVEPQALQPTAPEVWTKDFHDKTGILDGFWQFDDHKSPGSGSSDGRVASSTYGGTTPTFFDTAEMLWTDTSPRTNRRYGMPPTLLVEDFLQSLDLAITQEQQYLSRGSIPSGAWVFEEWDRQEVKEWKEQNAENVKGKPHKSLMFAGRGGDVKFEPMSMNFSELEFTERMKYYAKVVSAAFQVPTAVVGLEPEKINYNTFKGERQNFESNTLGPYLQKVERWITHDLIAPHYGDGYRFEFQPGMSESTRSMISERVTREFEAGLRRRNEARREVGLEQVEDEFDGFQDEVVEDTSPEDGLGEMLASGNENVRKDEPLRNTEAWEEFTVQPEMVEELQQDIADDVRAAFDAVLDDDEVREIIARLASDEEEKSLSALSRRLTELFSENDVVARIEDALRENTADAARAAIEDAVAATDEDPDVDVEAIEAQLRDREVHFADTFADEMAEDIRETVGDGWAEGKGTREIAEDIGEQADINEGWTGAERIARQELQIATGEARSEFAGDIGKVEVWNTSGDDRVRDAHEEMDGLYKWPGDDWVVDYSTEGRGVHKESCPGNSEPGIGCRCGVLLRDPDEVDDSNYAGDGSPR